MDIYSAEKVLRCVSQIEKKHPELDSKFIRQSIREEYPDANFVDLFPHQNDVVGMMTEHPSRQHKILVHDTGCGKTITAIATAEKLLQLDMVDIVVVVCNPTLLDNFRSQQEKYVIPESHESKYLITTPRKLSSAIKDPTSPDHTQYVNSQRRFVVIDEVHNLKAGISKKSPSHAVLEYARNSLKMIALTATPIPNSVNDIKYLEFLLGVKYSENRTYFSKHFSFVKKEDIGDEFPSYNIIDHDVEMNPKYLTEYTNIELRQETNYALSQNPWCFYTGVRQAATCLDNSSKLDELVKIAKGSKKVLIFSEFVVNGADIIHQKLIKSGIAAKQIYMISGETKQENRSERVEAFNKSENAIMIITRAGGEGLDFKGIRDVILTESLWNDAIEKQVIGRAVRYKSHTHLPPEERHVTIHIIRHIKPARINPNLYPEDFRMFPCDAADVIVRNISKEKFASVNALIESIRISSLSMGDIVKVE